jgi:hypothetical protein
MDSEPVEALTFEGDPRGGEDAALRASWAVGPASWRINLKVRPGRRLGMESCSRRQRLEQHLANLKLVSSSAELLTRCRVDQRIPERATDRAYGARKGEPEFGSRIGPLEHHPARCLRSDLSVLRSETARYKPPSRATRRVRYDISWIEA